MCTLSSDKAPNPLSKNQHFFFYSSLAKVNPLQFMFQFQISRLKQISINLIKILKFLVTLMVFYLIYLGPVVHKDASNYNGTHKYCTRIYVLLNKSTGAHVCTF